MIDTFLSIGPKPHGRTKDSIRNKVKGTSTRGESATSHGTKRWCEVTGVEVYGLVKSVLGRQDKDDKGVRVRYVNDGTKSCLGSAWRSLFWW